MGRLSTTECTYLPTFIKIYRALIKDIFLVGTCHPPHSASSCDLGLCALMAA